ncbi:MAG: hypothetical protein ACREU6_08360 [Steroidobacteraceae bacterium]
MFLAGDRKPVPDLQAIFTEGHHPQDAGGFRHRAHSAPAWRKRRRMTGRALLEHIFARLSRAESGGEIFGTDEARQWPDGALAGLIRADVLRPAQPAQVIECDGCERNCFKPVVVRPAEDGRPARAFISCDEPEDMGRIRVELQRLGQWQITGGTLAGAVGRLLGATKPAQAGSTDKHWVLGLLNDKEHKGEVAFSIENGVTLALAGRSIPLVHALTLDKGGLTADQDALLRLVEGDAQQPALSVGSAAWRKQNAKAAAQARHRVGIYLFD